jgi:hypothetical protein
MCAAGGGRAHVSDPNDQHPTWPRRRPRGARAQAKPEHGASTAPSKRSDRGVRHARRLATASRARDRRTTCNSAKNGGIHC